MEATILNSLSFLGINEDSKFGLVVLLFIVVFLILLTGVILNLFIRKLIALADKTTTVWDDAILNSFNGPLRLVIWSVGLTYTAEIIWRDLDADLINLVVNLRTLAVITALAWFVIRLLNNIEQGLLEKDVSVIGFDKVGIRAVNKILKVSALITAFLIALDTLGYSISGVLAFGGIGGIAVGFAARDLLANFFGGLIIYLDRPFTEGEVIRAEEKNILGTVEDIGWRLTRVRTFEKRLLYIPNSLFASMVIENVSRMTHRRIREVIGIRYDDITKVPEIVKQIENLLNRQNKIDSIQPLVVKLDYFNASSVDILINTYTSVINWTEFHAFKQDLMIEISNIITHNGAEIAFPTTTVHLHQSTDQSK